jgi:hypothetical protein
MPEESKGNETKDLTKISIDEIAFQLQKTTQERDAFKAQVDSLTEQLGKANGVIEAQVRANLGSELMARTNLTKEDLAKISTEEMAAHLKTLRLAKNASKPLPAGDAANQNPHFTMPDLYAEAWKKK